MADSDQGTSVHVYEYGESYDDLRPAFFIDERIYDDPQLAQTVVETADAAMTRAGVIYEVEVTSGVHATRPVGVPTWEEFKQRHFVEGDPLPVRPARREVDLPPSWSAMVTAVEASHRSLREELANLLTTALPGHAVSIDRDPGPLRRSAGSVDWSEESFGFEFTISAETRGLPSEHVLNQLSARLTGHGWELDTPVTRPGGVIIEGSRGLFSVFVYVQRLKVTLMGKSPLYRSPAAPADDFVIEPR